MSDYIPSFEHLPNEILLEIFDYMRFSDLIHAFYNLNHRFNSILYSSNIHLHILYPDDIEENNTNQKLLIQSIINHRFISRLRLTHDRETPDPQLINYSHIRSLILDTPTSKLLEQITPKRFPCLEYLRIGYISSQNSLIKLHQHIFSNAFLFLKTCSLNNITDDQSWTGSPFIHSLSIWSDNPRIIIERVLSALSNLFSLHLFLTWKSKCAILDKQIISPHSNLKSLHLHLNGLWTHEKLDSFLIYIPTVISLSLYSSYFDVHMVNFQWNFQRLAFIFLSRLPNLSQFHCELIFQNFKSFDFPSIASYHSCFHRMQYELHSENEQFIRLFTQ